MSDLEKLKSMLDSFGVEYDVDDSTLLYPHQRHDDTAHSIDIFEGSKKVTGHANFFTLFEFDKDGKFLQVGAWE